MSNITVEALNASHHTQLLLHKLEIIDFLLTYVHTYVKDLYSSLAAPRKKLLTLNEMQINICYMNITEIIIKGGLRLSYGEIFITYCW